MSRLDEAVEAIRTGNPDLGRQILEDVLEEDEHNEEVWLWLSSVVETDEEREICLENVLALNPDNVVAQRGLEALQQGTFNVHTIMSEALDEDEEFVETTFIDEFVVTDEDSDLEDDEELLFPSTMAPPDKKGKKKKPAKGGGLNIRLILLGLFVVVVVLALAGVAAFNLFLGGDGNGDLPPEGQSQEQPAEGAPSEPAEEPTATETPTALPTDTPTPTRTPFILPTPKPTDQPTPTATPVVAPTPG
jgi:hypothetical protein